MISNCISDAIFFHSLSIYIHYIDKFGCQICDEAFKFGAQNGMRVIGYVSNHTLFDWTDAWNINLESVVEMWTTLF